MVQEQIRECRGIALGNSGGTRHQRRNTAAQGFMRAESVGLIEGWLHHDVGCAEKVRNILDESEHAYALAQSRFFRLRLPVRYFCAISCCHQINVPRGISAQLSPGFKE